MVELSRRFFLKGAISLTAAVTFAPSISAMQNLPTIYGDGVGDDTGGLSALFRNDPVTFNKEQIGVDSHKGITFHHGIFNITRTVEIPRNSVFKIDGVIEFVGEQLEELPFFRCIDKSGYQFTSKCLFEMPVHVGDSFKIIEYYK